MVASSPATGTLPPSTRSPDIRETRRHGLRLFHGAADTVGRGRRPDYQAILAATAGQRLRAVRLTEQGRGHLPKSPSRHRASQSEALVAARWRRPYCLGARGAGRVSRGGGGAIGGQHESVPGGDFTTIPVSSIISSPRRRSPNRRTQHRLTSASRRSTRRTRICAPSLELFLGQARLNLPGWFGFGSAVESFVSKAPKRAHALLQRMSAEWPFFRALLSQMDMVLAKADMHLAKTLLRAGSGTGSSPHCVRFARRGMAAHDEGAEPRSPARRRRLADNPALAASLSHRFPILFAAQPFAVGAAAPPGRGEHDDKTLRAI